MQYSSITPMHKKEIYNNLKQLGTKTALPQTPEEAILEKTIDISAIEVQRISIPTLNDI